MTNHPKLAEELRSARDFQAGYDHGLAGEPSEHRSLEYDGGYVAGQRQRKGTTNARD